MLFAIDKEGNRIHINYALRGQEYVCPCCEEKVVLKKGNIRKHHYAHHSGSMCRDGWHYDMSDWHQEWQNKFPLQYQEIVKELNGKKHRADVLIEDKKIVFEFQHSALSSDEFYDRNIFYNTLGYKVIWVFDEIEQYISGEIDNYRGDLWAWEKYRKTFDDFNCKDKRVEVYLHLEDDYLVRVTWSTGDKGFSRFATDGHCYSVQEIITLHEEEKIITKYESKLSTLYDDLIKLYSKDHTTYYFGCPISSTHMCANCNIDIPKGRYMEIMPCMECSFQYSRMNYEEIICRKRFLDLGLSGDTLVRVESRNKDGFIDKLSYIYEGERKYIELPTFNQNISKDIFTLWKEKGYSVAIFRNVRTGKYIKITKNPIMQLSKYRKVYGYFSTNKYSFPTGAVELFGLEKSEWVCEWFK